MRTLLLCFALTHPLAAASVEIIAGSPATASLSEPFSVDFDSTGIAYGVEFTQSNRVFRLSPDGSLDFIAGARHSSDSKTAVTDVFDGSDPLQARFNGMHDIQVTSTGTAIIADSFNHRLRLFDLATGAVSTLAGTGEKGFAGDDGPARTAQFNITMTACLSPDEKSVYIADIGNHRTRRIDLATGVITTVAGNGKKGLPSDGADALATPMGDTRAVTQAHDGTLYVLLRGGNALVEVKDGRVRTVVNTSGTKGYSGDGGPALDATMNGPKYVAMDAQNRVLIADAENHCIRRYDPTTETITLIAGTPTQPADQIGDTLLTTGLRRPHGVRVSPSGHLYICDTYNNRILRADYR